MRALNPLITQSLANMKGAGGARDKAARRAPTYIVKGGADDKFYNAARAYYDSWDYGPTTPVASMEAIVDKLAVQKNVEHVRIVTHGWLASTEQAMELPLFDKGKGHPEIGTRGIDSERLQLTKPGTYVAQVLEDLLADDKAPAALRGATRLVGRPLSQETKESAKAAGLMQDKPQDFHTHYYEWSSERTAVAALAVLALVRHYQNSGRNSMKPADVSFLETTFTDLKRTALGRAETSKRSELDKFLADAANDARTVASTIRNPEAILGQLLTNFRGPLARARNEAEGGTVKGTFFFNLARAREALAPRAEIEIRGCNIGREQKLMTRLQDMFAVPGGKAPTVSAPALFQVFDKMAVTPFKTEDPAASPQKFEPRVSLFTRRDEALANNEIIVNMNPEPQKFDEVLQDFHRGDMVRLTDEKAKRRREQLFPRAKIAQYNPQLNLEKVPAFGVIWLRQASESERKALQKPEPDTKTTPDLIDELRSDSTAAAPPLRGVDRYANRTEKHHQLLARLSDRAQGKLLNDPKVEATVREWVRRFLGEELEGPVQDHLWITYLTAHSNQPLQQNVGEVAAAANLNGNQDLAKGDPILYPGQPQFWRHINVTRGRG